MALFDAYLFIDWSARSVLSPVTPTRDSIWVGESARGEPVTETYCRGRHEATALVRERLLHHADLGRRVLVGFDFPYGYPAGLAAALGLEGDAPWRAVWDHLGEAVEDDEFNANNRFVVAAELNRRLGEGPGPFWGHPGGIAIDGLTPTKTGLFSFPFAVGAAALERLRRTEMATAGVQESWKLMYTGSVGSQALLGIPRVLDLRDDPSLAPFSAVWPFETGFTASPAAGSGPFVLHAEIWPGITGAAAVREEMAATGAIQDQAQVRLMCRWAAQHDVAGTLGERFNAPGSLSDDQRRIVEREEGWILS